MRSHTHDWRGEHLRGLFLTSLMALVYLGACDGRGDRIEVEVCGAQVAVPEQIDAVRVSVLDSSREELRAGTRELVLCPQDELLELPQVVEFESLDAQDAWVVVQGLKDGVEVLRYERRATLSTGVIEQVQLVLDPGCLGVQCALGQTCVAGTCEIVSVQGGDQSLCQGSASESSLDMAQDTMEPGEDMGEAMEQGPRYCPAPASDEDES